MIDSIGLESEINYFPTSEGVGAGASGRVLQCQFGIKAGKRFKRFGFFGKARPGFVSFDRSIKLVGTEPFTFGTIRSYSLNESSKRPANSFGNWDRPLRLAIDEDMYEVACCGRKSLALFEDRKFVADARIPQLPDAQPDFDHFRKSQRLEVLALRLGGKCDDFPGGDIEATFSDEILVDSRVEKSVVQRIVNVAVDVVVHPTRRQRHKVRIL